MKEWGKTYFNALLSTAPVVLIVAILNWTGVAQLAGVSKDGKGQTLFWLGALLLFIGIGLFSIGTDNAMSKIGEHVGSSMTQRKNLASIVLIIFLLGVFVTIAEPDLSVLAKRLSGAINNYLFIILVGIGVGIFLVIGVIRILFQKSLKVWLLAFYALLFALAILVNEKFIPLTFDSGGVTTGPVTVPFIIALGVGLAASRAGKGSDSDSFGLTAFCSIGPLLVVLIFGLVVGDKLNIEYTDPVVATVGGALLNSFTKSCANVGVAMAPVVLFFFIYQSIFIKLPKKEILKIIVGLFYTYVGLVLFLTGVEGAFTPVADSVGRSLVDRGQIWLLLLVAGAIGLVVVLCEPAVQVLVKQVEQISEGMVKRKHMLIALSAGIGLAVILSVVRIIYNFSIFYYLVPGYIIALGLTFAVPDIYVGIAFDSGGVASGPMTSAFIMPFTIGVAHKIYEVYRPVPNEGTFILTQAFGTVALVAMMPLIVIQLLGLNANLEKSYNYRLARKRIREENDNQVIHFGA